MSTPDRRRTGAGVAAGSRLLLGLRAPVFAVVAVALSAGAHVLGGGQVPEAGGLLLMALAVDVSFRVAARRELSSGRLLTALAASQLVLHQLLVVGEHHPVAGSRGGPGMLAGHAAAVAVLAWWLRRGEAAAWRAARRRLRPLLRPPAPAPVACAPSRGLPAVAPGLPRAVVVALRADPRRGPPALPA